MLTSDDRNEPLMLDAPPPWEESERRAGRPAPRRRWWAMSVLAFASVAAVLAVSAAAAPPLLSGSAPRWFSQIQGDRIAGYDKAPAAPTDALVNIGPVPLAGGYAIDLYFLEHGQFSGRGHDVAVVELERDTTHGSISHLARFDLPAGVLRLKTLRKLRLVSGGALGKWGAFDFTYAPQRKGIPLVLSGNGVTSCRGVKWRASSGVVSGRFTFATPLAGIGTVTLKRAKAFVQANVGTLTCGPPPPPDCTNVATATTGTRNTNASADFPERDGRFLTTGIVDQFGDSADGAGPQGFLGAYLPDSATDNAPAHILHAIYVQLPAGFATFAPDLTSAHVALDGLEPELSGSLDFATPTAATPPSTGDCWTAYNTGTVSGNAALTLDWGGTIPFVGPSPVPAVLSSSVLLPLQNGG